MSRVVRYPVAAAGPLAGLAPCRRYHHQVLHWLPASCPLQSSRSPCFGQFSRWSTVEDATRPACRSEGASWASSTCPLGGSCSRLRCGLGFWAVVRLLPHRDAWASATCHCWNMHLAVWLQFAEELCTLGLGSIAEVQWRRRCFPAAPPALHRGVTRRRQRYGVVGQALEQDSERTQSTRGRCA
jgi:hypothetical protein